MTAWAPVSAVLARAILGDGLSTGFSLGSITVSAEESISGRL